MYQDYLNLATIFITIILFQLFRHHIRKMDVACDVLDISAMDYTIMLKGIPLEFDAINNDYDDDIKDFFEKNTKEGDTIEVNNYF